MYMKGCRALGVHMYMREDIIKMELEKMACVSCVD